MSYPDLLQALDLLIGITIAVCLCIIGYTLGRLEAYVRFRTDSRDESGQGTTATSVATPRRSNHEYRP